MVYKNPERKVFTTPYPKKFFLDLLNKDSKILELGCGYGRILDYLYKKGFKNLEGVDVSPVLISKAKTNCSNIPLHVCDILHYKSPHKFDAIISCGVHNHFVTKTDQEALVQKINDLCTPKGLFYLETFPLDMHDFAQYFLAWCRGFHFGSRYLKEDEIMVLHQSIKATDKLFSSKFTKIYGEKDIFTTWSNTQRNGYCGLYKKQC